MNLRKTLLYNTIGLPAYWAQCRRARDQMEVSARRVAYGHHSRQYAMVLTPPAGQHRAGYFAFYFHGGAWTFGRPETFVSAATPWLAQGYQVILPSYRRPPAVGLRRIVADCRAAVGAFTNGQEVRDIQLGGISAGAHLAATLALDQSLWAEQEAYPSAVLCCAGPLDLSLLRPRPLFIPRYLSLNPLEQLDQDARPDTRWLLLHGPNDATVAMAHSRRFHTKLKRLDKNSKLLVVPNGTHLDSGRWMFGGFGAAEVAAFIAPSLGA